MFELWEVAATGTGSPKAVSAAAVYLRFAPLPRRPAPLADADGRAEDVVEVRRALGGDDRVASPDVRLVHERLVAAPHEREAVPEEGLRPGGQGAARPTVLAAARPTVLAVVRARELPVDVVGVAVRPLPVRHGQHLVEVAVAVGPVSFPHEPPRRVVREHRRVIQVREPKPLPHQLSVCGLHK